MECVGVRFYVNNVDMVMSCLSDRVAAQAHANAMNMFPYQFYDRIVD